MTPGPAGRTPRRAIGHRAIWIGLLLLVLAVLACVRWPVPTDMAERWLAQRLQRTVTIEGGASVCLCPRPSLRVASIAVGPPDWSSQPHFLRTTDTEVRLVTTSLLSGRPRIAFLHIGGGEVVLERRPDGRASWHVGPDRDPHGRAEPPRIERLEANGIAWHLIDPARGVELRGMLSLTDGMRAPDGADPGPTLVMTGSGMLRKLPVELSARGGGAVAPEADAPSSEARGAQPIVVRARAGKGRLAFDGEVDSLTRLDGLRGSYRVEGPALAALKARVAGGRLLGEIVIDAGRDPARFETKLEIREVALQRWLPPLRGEPPITSRLNATLSLGGRGNSVAEVLARAAGSARIALGPGSASRLMLEVAGLDIAESLAVLSTGDRRVRLDCGLADIAIERGVAQPKLMLIDTHDTVLSGEGRVDLSKELLALKIRAAPRDFSPLTVRSPILVSGSFKAPRVAVDKTRVAGTVAASVLLGAVVTPLAALLPMLDFGEGDPPSPCSERFKTGASKAPRAPRTASGPASGPPRIGRP